MTLKEMAAEYRSNAALLQCRVTQLKLRLSCCSDPLEEQMLDRRIRVLKQLYRESRATARIMDTYYEMRRDRHVSKSPCTLFELSEQ